MSQDDASAIDRLSQIIKWLVGSIAVMLAGAASMGGWVATQQNSINNLTEADRVSIMERSELRGEIRAHAGIIQAVQKDSAVQSRDLQYIREAVTEIKDSIKRTP